MVHWQALLAVALLSIAAPAPSAARLRQLRPGIRRSPTGGPRLSSLQTSSFQLPKRVPMTTRRSPTPRPSPPIDSHKLHCLVPDISLDSASGTCDMFQRITLDLAPFRAQGGIDLASQREALFAEDQYLKRKVLFRIRGNGTELTTHLPRFTEMREPHRKKLVASTLGLLADVASAAGGLPDVEFVLSYGDRPSRPKREGLLPQVNLAGEGVERFKPLPILSFSKTVDHYDILFPNTDYPTFKRGMLGGGNGGVPWRHKFQRAFWRGSTAGSPYWLRGGERPQLAPRFAIVDAAKKAPELIDAGITENLIKKAYVPAAAYFKAKHKKAKRVPFTQHDRWAYLLVVDGIGYSGRFRNLMTGSSAVFRLNVHPNGAPALFEHWHGGLVAYKHVVPVQVHNLAAHVMWGRGNPEELQKLAAAGREHTEAALSRTATVCYVKRLLTELAGTLKYSVGHVEHKKT